jgi:UPF0716 protein FxsA
MPFALLGLFVAVPLVEVYLFIKVGSAIGALPTVLACIATATAGALIVRHQGAAVMDSARRALQAGRAPAAEAFDGVCLVLAGLLLMTPGFFTDAMGFLLLVPPLRHLLRRWLAAKVEVSGFEVRRGPGGTVVEGEWEVVDEPSSGVRVPRGPRLDPPRR